MLVTYCFCLTDVDAALHSVSGFPYIYVFQTGTGSTGGAVGLTSVILILGIAGATSFFASTSRQTFAFARDSKPAHITSRDSSDNRMQMDYRAPSGLDVCTLAC